jgi:DNA mismatch repair protein MutS
MDAALGPPESMLEAEEELTPMIRQYVECCERYDDCLVLFHVGDFYKTFGDAAETVSRTCELALASREDSTGEYRMAGIPIDSAESYVERLLDTGYRVAIAEQVEDPEQVSGVAERRVTRVVTPGTLTEDELLAGDDHTFVAAVAAGERHGLALLDVSTGDFYATAADGAGLATELGRFAPAEVVVGPDVDRDVVDGATPADCALTGHDPAVFDREAAGGKVADYFGAPDAELADPAEVRACGALLAYAEYARGGTDGELAYLNHLVRYDSREYLTLDAVAIRSLELFERRSVHGAAGAALVDILDETASALGARRLRDWLRRPLLDEERIAARHDAVEALVGDVRTRERLADLLASAYDVERLVSRLSRGRANARDLNSLAETLGVVPEIRALLDDVDAGPEQPASEGTDAGPEQPASERTDAGPEQPASEDTDAGLLGELRERLDPVADVREEIDRAIADDPPVELTEGGLIREGYDEELDALRATEREGKAWVADLQERERERTGIDNLEVGHNAVHGYYIEVTDANLDRVPDDYTRRQTLKNAERFYTSELKEREDEILTAAARADDLEYDLFVEVRDGAAAESERLQATASALAALDALVALAETAAASDYVRPEVGADRFRVEGARHPVVERTQEAFVPNPVDLERGALAVLTGPNMSGKSTYMRQVALLCVLAQAGSFVPAAAAELPVVDRVFTRVGATDDIAGGRSTFMVEMTEVADVLREATGDSLVLLDEVGRGTSTADGFAIARAVAEHLHDEVGATTLFATHHHDLTGVAADLSRGRNHHFAAEQRDGRVHFDHEIREGPAAASYGVEVAREAGVPGTVVERAGAVVDDDAGRLDEDGESAEGTASLDRFVDGATGNGDGTAGDGAEGTDGSNPGDALRERLRELDLATTTPVEALTELAELQELAEDGRDD